jgi:protocatechuate 3,4-dioxygenase beta subunit
MERRTLLVGGGALVAGLTLREFAVAREPVIGGPCEGCEWVFDDQPAKLTSHARIAPVDERGVPLVIEGTVTRAGSPAAGVIVYAYHTDANGIYPPARNRHGRLRGWAVTDAQGRYRFDTIRPGAYPQLNTPEHVHMHVIEPGRGTYYIDDLRFTDDPLNPPARRRTSHRGGDGLATPEKRGGTWFARRDIVLGMNIP